MKNKNVLLIFMMALTFSAMVFQACNKDEDPAELTVVSMTAGTIDLNGATSPANVPVDSPIVTTFSTDVDATTATAANIKMLQDYDNTDIELDITVSGKTITVTPKADLGTGTLHKLTFNGTILSTEGKALTEVSRTFTTVGTFAPAGVIAHYTFEENTYDVVGSFNPSATIGVTYVAGRNTAAGKAANFNGTTSIIEIPNGDVLMNGPNFTLSFWMKAVSEGQVNENGDPKGHFVMGLGAFHGFQFEMFGDYGGCKMAATYEFEDGTTGGEDLWFPANGNVDWQGWTFCADYTSSGGLSTKVKDVWANFVITYDGASREGKMYLNGELAKAQDFDLWPDGDAKRTVKGLKYAGVAPEVVNELALGFIQSRAGTLWDNEPWGGYGVPTANHFRGQLDDVRFFHKALTATEIQLMYNSEKP